MNIWAGRLLQLRSGFIAPGAGNGLTQAKASLAVLSAAALPE